MNKTREPLEILADVPGWEGAAVSELSGGLTNLSWLVDKDGNKAVLKIDEEPRSVPYNTRPAEARIQSIAAEGGLASNVLYFDDQAIMTDYANGRVWDAACFERDANIEKVAGVLKRLHSLPLTGRSFDPNVAADRYAANIESADTDLIAHCTRVIGRQRPPHSLCCCHNDLVAANVIATPELKLLDWEYACDNDPLFDLATIVEHHQLDEPVAIHLLDAYFDGDGKRWRSKLLDQQQVYQALCWLWTASRPVSTQEDLDSIAARIMA